MSETLSRRQQNMLASVRAGDDLLSSAAGRRKTKTASSRRSSTADIHGSLLSVRLSSMRRHDDDDEKTTSTSPLRASATGTSGLQSSRGSALGSALASTKDSLHSMKASIRMPRPASPESPLNSIRSPRHLGKGLPLTKQPSALSPNVSSSSSSSPNALPSPQPRKISEKAKTMLLQQRANKRFAEWKAAKSVVDEMGNPVDWDPEDWLLPQFRNNSSGFVVPAVDAEEIVWYEFFFTQEERLFASIESRREMAQDQRHRNVFNNAARMGQISTSAADIMLQEEKEARKMLEASEEEVVAIDECNPAIQACLEAVLQGKKNFETVLRQEETQRQLSETPMSHLQASIDKGYSEFRWKNGKIAPKNVRVEMIYRFAVLMHDSIIGLPRINIQLAIYAYNVVLSEISEASHPDIFHGLWNSLNIAYDDFDRIHLVTQLQQSNRLFTMDPLAQS